MENKSFDDIIKSKLDQFSMKVDSNAWERFQESEADALFDQGIAEKIAGYTTSETPPEFEYLNDHDETPVGFDALIGAKLAGLNVDEVSDWDQFEKILDGDAEFDQEVAQKVAAYEAPVSESQWPKLAAHLEKVEQRRRRIVITKLIEAAVFILFILSIMQLYPIQNINKSSVYRTHGVVETLKNSKAGINSEKSNDDEVLKESEIIASNLITPIKTIEADIKNVSLTSNSDASLEPEQRRDAILAIHPLKRNKINAVDFERSEKKIGKTEASRPLLASITIPEIEINDRNFDNLIFGMGSAVKRDQYWFNLYGSPEISIINTPYDRSYNDNRFINNEDGDVEAYTHVTSGYSLGGSISKETATYEVEVGLEYTSLNYFPAQIEEKTGKFSTGITTTLLKEIIFDIVEIPVNLKYNLFRKNGWKIYGSNGVSGGLVAFANYDIDEETSPPFAALAILEGSQINDVSFLDRKKFDRGFFKTENFKDNIFATVNAGVGVSKDISDKVGFYIQPTYHYNLSQGGIGPNNDVHHRLSVQIGTKVRI